MPIDDRKQRVLRAIVMLYGAQGEPVGSGLLAQQLGHAVSSATLRNEIAALTKLGLLEQPRGACPAPRGTDIILITCWMRAPAFPPRNSGR